jgi:negative regulator of sigma E activity
MFFRVNRTLRGRQVRQLTVAAIASLAVLVGVAHSGTASYVK